MCTAPVCTSASTRNNNINCSVLRSLTHGMLQSRVQWLIVVEYMPHGGGRGRRHDVHFRNSY